MAYISLETFMAKFPFTDLHSFKDYVVFVQTYAPDRFHPREGVGENEQWTLDLAFEGLRFGLDLTVEEKGKLPALAECRALVEEAFADYQQGKMREGFFKLEQVQKLLKKIPSQ
jgi:hypothetical protein